MGQTIRVQQSEIYINMVKLLGATPMALPYKEVQAALQQKKVDCAENNMPAYESTGHYKVARYVYLTNHVVSPEVLVVSTKLWGQLSKDDQALFLKAGQKSALLMRELWSQRVASARATVVKDGAQIVAVSDFAPFGGGKFFAIVLIAYSAFGIRATGLFCQICRVLDVAQESRAVTS